MMEQTKTGTVSLFPVCLVFPVPSVNWVIHDVLKYHMMSHDVMAEIQ